MSDAATSYPGEEPLRHTLRLEGCRQTPLGSYLKALGVLRLVAEQKDAGVRGSWRDGIFVLEGALDADGLSAFLLKEYEPTPVLAPWNGGSGFYPKDNKEAFEPIRDGTATRLRAFRETIIDVEGRIQEKGLKERPEPGDQKAAFLMELRATAGEGFLRWIDAAVTTSAGELLYPPLLGTGGNDGRLDFTNNFMINLVALIDPDTGEPREGARALAGDALFATPVAGLPNSAIGQFAPGSAGGPNAESGFSGSPLINPWDFLLMLEGSLLLAASTARRLEARGRGVLAYPFTVRPTGAGSGGAAPGDEEPARAESWMPLWARPSTADEVQRVLMEGRIVLNRQMSRDGLDVARAVAKLGTDRGIDAFQRFAYMRRSGLAYLATPLGCVRVQRNSDADIIDDLDGREWLHRFRRIGREQTAPARLVGLLHQLEDALFDLAQMSRSPVRAQRCLILLSRCQRYLARSPSARERCPPVPVLSDGWVSAADDGSPAFILAAALAGLHGVTRRADEGATSRAGWPVATTAEYMAPVATARDGRTRHWEDGAANRVVWTGGPLDGNLGRMMSRRLLDQRKFGLVDRPLRGRCFAPVSAIAEWLHHPDWDPRINALVEGLALVGPFSLRREGSGNDTPIPAMHTLLKPFFVPESRLGKVFGGLGLAAEDVSVPPPDKIVRLLRANHVDRAADLASRTLRARGVPPPPITPRGGALSGPRLLSSLMVPMSMTDLHRTFRSYFKSGRDSSESNPLKQEA